MHKGKVFLTVLLIYVTFVINSPQLHSQDFEIKKNAQSIDIYQDAELITTYHYRSGSKPIFWPLIGPDGKKFSRDYPMVPDSKDEEHDHPHHRSVWMTFGEVNEHDLWAEGKGKGVVCQVGDPEVVVSNGKLTLLAKHLWKGGVKDVSSVSTSLTDGCTESAETLASCDATYVIHGTKDERIMDFFYVLTASQDLHFGDTKEGMFAIRIPEPMRADKAGGHILSSEGRKDGEAWGYPARWVDYSGRVERNSDKIYGIAILVHPDSFQANGRWHVRTYGLFAHDPFGVKDFPKLDTASSSLNDASPKIGGYKLAAGESLSFAYRVILHRNTWSAAEAEERFSAFTEK
ncbi:PmoA family protein [Pirellulaceae bacterium SH449]